jgi:hypothetical protein
MVRPQVNESEELRENPRSMAKPIGMNEADQKHFKVAQQLSPNGRIFSRQEFLKRFAAEYPDTPIGNCLPQDYAHGQNPSVRKKPKFLERIGGQRSGMYRLITPATAR